MKNYERVMIIRIFLIAYLDLIIIFRLNVAVSFLLMLTVNPTVAINKNNSEIIILNVMRAYD